MTSFTEPHEDPIGSNTSVADASDSRDEIAHEKSAWTLCSMLACR
jgi:hypothetical protein